MPTQEERLDTLERSFAAFQKEAGRHIRETDENTTILLGVIRSQGRDIRSILEHEEAVDGRLEGIEKRLERLEESFVGSIDQRLGRLEKSFDEQKALLMRILASLEGERKE